MVFEEQCRNQGSVSAHKRYVHSPDSPELAAQQLLERLEESGLCIEERRKAVSGLLRLTIGQVIPVSLFADFKEEMIQRFLHEGEFFGVSQTVSERVAQCLDFGKGIGEFAIVTHEEPDLDGASAAYHMRSLLEAKGETASIYAGDGTIEALRAQLPNSAVDLELKPVSEVRTDQRIILVDANNPHSKNVGLDPNVYPFLIVDTHFPTKGVNLEQTEVVALEDHTATITVVIGSLLPIVPEPIRENFLRSKKWSDLATWALLGIVSDSANARRASPHDVEAVYRLLPFVDPQLLGEYEDAPFHKHVKAFVKKGRAVLRQDGKGLAAHLGKVALHARHSAAAASDYLLSGTGADVIMVTYEVNGHIHASFRVNPRCLLARSINVRSLAKDVIGENSGARKGGVAGGSILGTTYGEPEATAKCLQELFFQKMKSDGN